MANNLHPQGTDGKQQKTHLDPSLGEVRFFTGRLRRTTPTTTCSQVAATVAKPVFQRNAPGGTFWSGQHVPGFPRDTRSRACSSRPLKPERFFREKPCLPRCRVFHAVTTDCSAAGMACFKEPVPGVEPGSSFSRGWLASADIVDRRRLLTV